MTDIIKAVRTFTEAVGCTTDRFNVRQTALYLGLMAEEFCEAIESLEDAHDVEGGITYRLKELSLALKSGKYDDAVEAGSKEGLLDACIDLAWVSIGCAYSQGADVEGAAGEVMRANVEKLVVRGGKLEAIKDSNGKVIKPTGWIPPNISQFVNKKEKL